MTDGRTPASLRQTARQRLCSTGRDHGGSKSAVPPFHYR